MLTADGEEMHSTAYYSTVWSSQKTTYRDNNTPPNTRTRTRTQTTETHTERGLRCILHLIGINAVPSADPLDPCTYCLHQLRERE
jgi:hypothetical protein